MNLVGILKTKSHNEFRAICADITERRSAPPPAEEQSAHQSPLKGGNRNNGVNSSPSFSLEFRFSTLRVPSFWSPEGCTSRTTFCRRRAGIQSAWRARKLQQRVSRDRL